MSTAEIVLLMWLVGALLSAPGMVRWHAANINRCHREDRHTGRLTSPNRAHRSAQWCWGHHRRECWRAADVPGLEDLRGLALAAVWPAAIGVGLVLRQAQKMPRSAESTVQTIARLERDLGIEP